MVETNDGGLPSLVCPGCGATFASAMQMDQETFEKIRVENILERCSECGQASRFSKPDYTFRSA